MELSKHRGNLAEVFTRFEEKAIFPKKLRLRHLLYQIAA